MSKNIEESFVVGKVDNVTDAKVDNTLLQHTGMVSKKQLVEIEVMEGPLRGKKVVVANEITDNPAFNIHTVPGKEVILSIVTEDGIKPEINIADYNRTPTLAILFFVFLLAFVFFGGSKSIKSLIGLIVGIALIAFVLLPLSLRGFDPLLTAAVICVIATAATLTAIGGLSSKSLSAIIGTIGGVIISGTAAHLVIVAAPLTGLSSEEAQILRGSMLSQSPIFFQGLLAAGMLIGALGVIMDVGMSIASAVFEVSQSNTQMNMRELYRAGMNIGQDIMGTMTNTLVFAYVGTALPLLLLLSQIPSTKFLNLDLVATEVASTLAGSLGLVCTIPLTAYAAAKLMCPKNK